MLRLGDLVAEDHRGAVADLIQSVDAPWDRRVEVDLLGKEGERVLPTGKRCDGNDSSSCNTTRERTTIDSGPIGVANDSEDNVESSPFDLSDFDASETQLESTMVYGSVGVSLEGADSNVIISTTESPVFEVQATNENSSVSAGISHSPDATTPPA